MQEGAVTRPVSVRVSRLVPVWPVISTHSGVSPMGEAIASLAAVLDPGAVVIGGGVSESGDLLLDPIRAAFVDELTGRGHRPFLDVRAASLANGAGMIGAADLARR